MGVVALLMPALSREDARHTLADLVGGLGLGLGVGSGVGLGLGLGSGLGVGLGLGLGSA